MQPSPWCWTSACVLFLLVACGARAPVPGDACRNEVATAVCVSPDHALACRAFTWHEDACRGPLGCQAGHCDQRLSSDGDACELAGATTCSVDGTALLRCDGATMSVVRRCRGDHGCARDTPDDAPVCDLGQPVAGDACDDPVGRSRCGPGGKTLLRCDETAHYALGRTCAGPRGCSAYVSSRHDSCGSGHFVACDSTVGDVGEPCDGYVGVGSRVGNGGAYCSTDQTQLLTCHDGILAPHLDCACVVHWNEEGSIYSVGCAPSDAGAGNIGSRGLRVVASSSAVHLFGAAL